MYQPELPYHGFPRGSYRCARFFNTHDREYYPSLLAQTSKLYCMDLHTNVLMTIHTHLLVTRHSEDSIARITRVAGSRYVQGLNKKHGRSRTLWEGQHK